MSEKVNKNKNNRTEGENMLTLPNERGRFGMFGGKFVPETLMRPLADIEQQLHEALADPSFHAEYMRHLYEYSGRPTALTFAKT